MIKNRACNRCYKRKDKCSFQDRVDRCVPCLRSGSVCTNARSKPRTGRRPRTKTLGPESSVQIWDPDKNNLRITFVHAECLPSEGRGTRHCFLGNEEAETLRTYTPSSPSPYDYQLSSMKDPFDNPPPSKERFYATYQLFMFGPSFAPRIRAAYQYSYSCSPILLNDILLAIFKAAVLAGHHRTLHDQDEVDFDKGTTCLRKLRTAYICNPRDVLGVLVLGQTLAAFDFLTHSFGSMSILRYSLSIIQPYYTELSKVASLDPVTIAPVFWDILSCLLCRNVPVIRYIPRDSQIVDRVAGFCTSLLPILYDLCVANHSTKQQPQLEHTLAGENVSDLQQITQQLEAWVPTTPSDLNSSFLRHEILSMAAQASMYRLAGLLIAHRIKSPIGSSDEVAKSYAISIVLELRNYNAAVIPDTQLLNVSFPLLLAMFELPDASHEIWNSTTLSVANPTAIAQMSSLVEYVWSKRGAGYAGPLFDLVDSGPDIVVFP